MKAIIEFVQKLGYFVTAVWIFMIYAVIHVAIYGWSDNPERARAIRDFEKDCIRRQTGGDYDLKQRERERVAEVCVAESRAFRQRYDAR